jgi:ribonuclease G
VVPGIEAYFIDIGMPRKGLLHFKDCVATSALQKNSIPNKLRVGQTVLAQIARPGIGRKGPRLTLRLSLPGRHVVLVSPWDAVGVSRRIELESERMRLKNIAEKMRPLDQGLIVRTEAEGATEEQIHQDVQELLRQLAAIHAQFSKGNEPAILYRDLGLLGRIMRDRLNSDVNQIVLDSPDDFAVCRAIAHSLAPDIVDRISLYDRPKPIFEHYGIERTLIRAQQKTVSLPHGGSLIIEETEALTAIDVNTGRFVGKTRLADTILQTNLEAVEEVALQLRLRGLGGVIVVDFIDMERTRDRIRVMDALEAALKQDRTKTHIVQLSPSGLVEITRRREGLSLRQLLNQNCSTCNGEGVIKTPETIAIQTRRRLRTLMSQHPGNGVKVKLHPAVAAHLIGSNGQHAAQLEASAQAQLIVQVDPQLHLEATQIEVTPGPKLQPRETSRFTLGMHDMLYPEDAAEFAVHNNMLVQLPSHIPLDDQQSKIQHVVVLEIVSVERWFAVARMVN